MRIAAAALAAIIAALALAFDSSARADQPSPFPSPSPAATAQPGSGGFAAIGVSTLSANGGSIPASAATSTPRPFVAAGATGYSIEVVGHLSQAYVASVRFDSADIHGDDTPIESRFETTILYAFGGSRTAAGLGYTSLQRSTVPAGSNGLGAGVMLLPDFTRRASAYGSLFYYPTVAAPARTHAGLFTARLGVTFDLPSATGLFARVGFIAQHFGAASISPTSLTGVEFGVGARF